MPPRAPSNGLEDLRIRTNTVWTETDEKIASKLGWLVQTEKNRTEIDEMVKKETKSWIITIAELPHDLVKE